MDRLPTLIAAAALIAAGCNDDRTGGASRERVNAVKATSTAGPDPAAMCDRHFAAGQGPRLVWPELTGAAPIPPDGAWSWINVWATWCKPCVEELPRLAAWQTRLAKAGAGVSIIFVSADESEEAITDFRAEHPNAPAGLRLRAPDEVAAWIEKLGVKGASLPVHIFVDPTGRVRCVRASAVEDSDYPSIEALLGG